MKTSFAITAIIFLMTFISCHSVKESKIKAPISNYENVSQPVNIHTTLDTLIIIEEPINDVVRTELIEVSTQADNMILRHVFYNDTDDTLDIIIKSSAGYTFPTYNRVILPKTYSENEYSILIKNLDGKISTYFYLSYTKRNDKEKKQYQITTVVNMVIYK